jgi:hypothetical protein
LDVGYVGAALGCFGLTIYSIWLDRAASAAVAATLAVAFLFLRHLPIIESFKAFNMEAKFARRIDESEKLLGFIRSAAEATSRMLYVQLGFLNRMSDVGWAKKRELIEQLDRNLTAIGVEDAFIRDSKRPFLNFVSRDLYAVFRGSADVLANRMRQTLVERQNEISSTGPVPADHSEYNELNRRIQMMHLGIWKFGDMSGQTRLENMPSMTKEVFDRLEWSDLDRQKLQVIASEVEELSAACWSQGTITPEAQAYIEQYSERTDLRLNALEEGVTP